MKLSRMLGTLLAAAILTPPAFTQASPDPYLERYAAALASDDGAARYEALSRLEAYGPAANELLLAALADKSDLISSQAQNWLIRQGHTAVAFLADALATVEEDSGLFATIVGGRERHRGKSIAATLWLTAGRGTAPERRYEVLESLLRHGSPRIRAVAVFTAVTLRSSEYLPLLRKAAEETDPLVHRTLRQGLVRLLQRESYSTPFLDAETEAGALDLLAPMLVEAAEDHEHGFGDANETYGEMLGKDPLEHHQGRFMGLLQESLRSPQLSPAGQENIGRALAAQAETEELEELTAGLLTAVPDPEGAEALPAQLIALSSFPGEAFSAESLAIVTRWLEAVREPHGNVARLAASAFSRAQSLGARELGDRTAAVISSLLADEASVAEAAIAAANSPTVWRKKPPLFAGQKKQDAAAALRQVIGEQAEALWNASENASAERTCDLMQVFLRLDDDRYFDLFERAWEHRSSPSPREQEALSGCLATLGYGLREPRLVELLRPYVAEARTHPHTLVRDTAASVLVGALAGRHEDFVDDEVFASWLAILEDPEVHPRIRARITMLIQTRNLSEERAERVRSASMRILAEPNDTNLREKILTRLTYMGDRGALPDAYGMLVGEDQIWWAYSNMIFELPGAAWKVESDELIDILEGMQRRYGPPTGEVRLIPVNNYFRWAVQYQIYPPRRIADELKRRTGEDFGYDVEAWRRWLEEKPSS